MKYNDYQIADLIKDISMGPFGSNIKAENYQESGVPYLNGSNLTGFELNEDSFHYVSEEKADSLGRSVAHRGDIIVTHRGTLGQIAYIPQNSKYEKYVTGNSQFRLTCNELVLPQYLMLYFHTPKGQWKLLSNASQVGVPALARPTSTFQKIEIEIPPVDYQRQVCSIFDSLQSIITINKQMIDNLFQQAKIVFDHFYKNTKEKVPYLSFIGVLGGGTPKTGISEFWDGDIPFFTPKDVGNPYTFQTEKCITEYGLEHCNSRLYPKNTSFVTARGTVGKVSLAGKSMAMNQSCYALMSKVLDPILVYFYTLKAVDSLKHKASGAVFDAIVTRDFESEVISLISEEDSEKLLAIIKPMMEAIHSNTEEIQRLSSLRDTLLPRLMSGEIDVSNVAI